MNETEQHRGSAHIADHLFHTFRFLQGNPARIERNPFTDKADHIGVSIIRPTVTDGDHARRVGASPADCGQAAHALLANAALIEHRAFQPVTGGQGLRLASERLRHQVVAGQVRKIARVMRRQGHGVRGFQRALQRGALVRCRPAAQQGDFLQRGRLLRPARSGEARHAVAAEPEPFRERVRELANSRAPGARQRRRQALEPMAERSARRVDAGVAPGVRAFSAGGIAQPAQEQGLIARHQAERGQRLGLPEAAREPSARRELADSADDGCRHLRAGSSRPLVRLQRLARNKHRERYRCGLSESVPRIVSFLRLIPDRTNVHADFSRH
ncbi:Uncharacterised protein [Mycobacterium tuberculosis]|nr:Uncharacterised protein [Mycobacterium tuberculosis]